MPFRASALFRSPASFSSISFPTRGKRYGRRRHSYSVAVKNSTSGESGKELRACGAAGGQGVRPYTSRIRKASAPRLWRGRAGSTRKGCAASVARLTALTAARGRPPLHKVGNAPTSIRQIFNGRTRNDTCHLSCAQEARFYDRPKGVRSTERGTTIRKM